MPAVTEIRAITEDGLYLDTNSSEVLVISYACRYCEQVLEKVAKMEKRPVILSLGDDNEIKEKTEEVLSRHGLSDVYYGYYPTDVVPVLLSGDDRIVGSVSIIKHLEGR